MYSFLFCSAFILGWTLRDPPQHSVKPWRQAAHTIDKFSADKRGKAMGWTKEIENLKQEMENLKQACPAADSRMPLLCCFYLQERLKLPEPEVQPSSKEVGTQWYSGLKAPDTLRFQEDDIQSLKKEIHHLKEVRIYGRHMTM